MNVKSMTGYGTYQVKSRNFILDVAIRSVNGRFLEIRIHAPRPYFHLESSIHSILENYFDRGTLDVFITRTLKSTGTGPQTYVNEKMAQGYDQALKKLSKNLGISYQSDVYRLVKLPYVLVSPEDILPSKQEEKMLLVATQNACEVCSHERVREGRSLWINLSSLLKQLSLEVKAMTRLRDQANRILGERLHRKLKTRQVNLLDLDPGRLAQEVALQVEKTDINEELVRLEEHIRNYRQILNEKDMTRGKKMDFYTQELLREVNTIGSKAHLSQLTQHVVECKALIEKLREQVQNIE